MDRFFSNSQKNLSIFKIKMNPSEKEKLDLAQETQFDEHMFDNQQERYHGRLEKLTLQVESLTRRMENLTTDHKFFSSTVEQMGIQIVRLADTLDDIIRFQKDKQAT